LVLQSPSVALKDIIPAGLSDFPENDKLNLAVNLQRIFAFPPCRVRFVEIVPIAAVPSKAL